MHGPMGRGTPRRLTRSSRLHRPTRYAAFFSRSSGSRILAVRHHRLALFQLILDNRLWRALDKIGAAQLAVASTGSVN
jgi:hypothetical protein